MGHVKNYGEKTILAIKSDDRNRFITGIPTERIVGVF